MLILFFSLIVGILVAVFSLANASPVSIHFLFTQVQNVSLALVIILSFLTGIALATVIGLLEHIRVSWKLRDYEARLRKYEAQLGTHQMRETPSPEMGTDMVNES